MKKEQISDNLQLKTIKLISILIALCSLIFFILAGSSKPFGINFTQFILLGAFGLFTSYNLWKNKKWAKIVIIIFSVLLLLLVFSDAKIGFFEIQHFLITIIAILIIVFLCFNIFKKN
ncbi:hypothetical protein J4405_05780 [Candidatus Woesearchaeota archaeon]|nr:hypothetical protein [Candidatus Woesearchaeota archaeon]